MAQLLFKQGDFKILSDDVGSLSAVEMNQLIKTAGTTCYQTRESSQKTPEEFIRMLQGRGHLAMLEHSWYTFLIVPPFGDSRSEIGFELFRANSLFCVTTMDGSHPPGLIISGNARMFNEAYKKRPLTRGLGNMLAYLNSENSVLFPSPPTIGGFELAEHFQFMWNPTLKTADEILTHRAMTVEFNNHCRGFTHEDVRSRNGDEKTTSYAQESTRYVDYARGDVNLEEFQTKFVLPYNDEFDFGRTFFFEVDGRSYAFTAQDFTNLMEGWYRAVRKAGLRPEEARQWLPIGIKSQIVQTYNLREWRHWFHIRANAPAHPEIRWSAVRLLKEVQRRIPDIFDDFEFKFKEDGSEYAVYTGEDKLV